MSDILPKPVTPEYEGSWERVFGKKFDYPQLGDEIIVPGWKPFPEFSATRQECIDAFKKSHNLK